MERIISKINKLLEVARRGGTEEEGKTAKTMADVLLKKYNLLLADVKDPTDPNDYMFDGAMTNTLRATWQDSIYVSICKLYFCTFHKTYSQDNKAIRRIVGVSENVDTAKKIAAHLILIAFALAKESTQNDKFNKAFKRGFASRIWARVDEQMQKEDRGTLVDSIPGLKEAEAKAHQAAAEEQMAQQAAEETSENATPPKHQMSHAEQLAFNKGASAAALVSLELHDFLK